MPGTRKLGRPTDQRMAMLKSLVTSLLDKGRIETTLSRAKEVRSLTEKLITLAIRERENVTSGVKKVSKAKLDAKGNKVTKTVTSKNGRPYRVVERELTTENVKLDMPTRLAARRKMISSLNKIKDANGQNIDIPTKLFDEYAVKYAGRNGGYTRVLKLGPRRGDGAEVAIIELV